ncbi:MAG: 1-phosphofructokinase family hexose kinase, partial [Candidatus Sericytochromatia bacterium]
EPVQATGLVAGHTGRWIEARLEAEGIAHAFHRLPEGESRLCLAIVQPGGGALTEINEDGPFVPRAEFEAFAARYAALVGESDWVALSGSLPPGLDGEAYMALMAEARSAGKAVSLDTSGPALRRAIEGRPDVVKPNQHEAEEALGYAITPESLPRALGELLDLGARRVALTLGEAGAAIATRDQAFFLTAPRVEPVNPVGSGDSFLAALIFGLRRGMPLAEAGRWAVAAGTANACVAGAAACSRAQIETLLPHVTVSPLAEATWGPASIGKGAS